MVKQKTLRHERIYLAVGGDRPTPYLEFDVSAGSESIVLNYPRLSLVWMNMSTKIGEYDRNWIKTQVR